MESSGQRLMRLALWMAMVAAAALVVLTTSSRVGSRVVHPGPDRADPYVGLKRPLEPDVSCCHGIHCGVATPCRTDDGKDGWLEENACIPLDERKRVNPPPSFWKMVDAPFHVCRSFVNGFPVLYCWMRADVY